MKLKGVLGLKTLSVALSCIILIMSMTISVFADLSLWHSDGITIGTWKNTQIKYAHKKLNNNSRFYFYASGLYAIKQWESALNISIENVISMSDANMKFYGGTWDELIAMGIELKSGQGDTLGFMVDYEYTSTIRVEILSNGQKVSVVEFEEATYAIIDKGFLSNYNSVTTHELGHALGWLGHSYDNNDMMYAIRSGVTELTARDREHLLQVY